MMNWSFHFHLSLIHLSWGRHQMETFSALLAFCAGNSPIPGEFPAQRPVTRSFDVFFDLCLNKRLSKQYRHRWFETPSCSLWRHGNAFIYYCRMAVGVIIVPCSKDPVAWFECSLIWMDILTEYTSDQNIQARNCQVNRDNCSHSLDCIILYDEKCRPVPHQHSEMVENPNRFIECYFIMMVVSIISVFSWPFYSFWTTFQAFSSPGSATTHLNVTFGFFYVIFWVSTRIFYRGFQALQLIVLVVIGAVD